MKYVKPSYLLLAIWLIVSGGTGLLGIGHPIISLALEILAIVTGIVILIELGRMSKYERLGMIFLAIWLILTGVLPIIGAVIPFAGTITIVQGDFRANLWFTGETLVFEAQSATAHPLEVAFGTWGNKTMYGNPKKFWVKKKNLVVTNLLP